jgi:NAD+ synthase/NAD+ synthase (glutamine-hydrolysing)
MPEDKRLRVGIVQHDPTVGDIEGNGERIERGVDEAVDAGADLVVTPELSVLGYPPRDLLHRSGLIERQRAAVETLAERTAEGPPVVVGAAMPTDHETGPPLANSAVVLREGEIVATYAKRLLPTYDVFDEHRYFRPGTEPVTVTVDGVEVGLSVCEDAWHDAVITGQRRHGANPLADLAAAGADLLVTISASPFSLGKPARREQRFAAHATATDRPVVFANQVGGNDDLIFDGHSLVVGPGGGIRERLEGFATETAVLDVPVGRAAADGGTATGRAGENGAKPREPATRAAQARRALALGLRDYFEKTGFETAIVGMSGGIDSSVAAALAADALGPDSVYGVTLPSAVTSADSITDAEAVADRLGIEFDTIPIGDATATLREGVESAVGEIGGLALENVQARVRGDVLMTIANHRDALVVTPDNKSEAAVGYCTLYGDTVGALAPLGDCYKTLVYELAECCNAEPPAGADAPVIPERVIEKPPTAELREGQTDADDLPPYDQLDPVLRAYIHGHETGDALREAYPDDVVDEALARLTRSEFKRWQTPPALRITQKAFGRGWKYPIAADYDELRGI